MIGFSRLLPMLHINTWTFRIRDFTVSQFHEGDLVNRENYDSSQGQDKKNYTCGQTKTIVLERTHTNSAQDLNWTPRIKSSHQQCYWQPLPICKGSKNLYQYRPKQELIILL